MTRWVFGSSVSDSHDMYNLLVMQGMSEDVSGNKFFDEAMMVELAQQTGDLHLQMI